LEAERVTVVAREKAKPNFEWKKANEAILRDIRTLCAITALTLKHPKLIPSAHTRYISRRATLLS